MREILIVDNQYLLRTSLRTIIEEVEPAARIVEAETISEALSFLNTNRFDLVVFEVSTPNSTRIEATDFSRQVSFLSNLLVCSAVDEGIYAEYYLLSGAKGFVHKSAKKEELIAAISTVLAGHYYVSQNVHSMLLRGRKNAPGHSARLSTRESEVIALILQGKVAKEIAAVLNIRANTVSSHKSNIFRKMQVNNIVDLARKLDPTCLSILFTLIFRWYECGI